MAGTLVTVCPAGTDPVRAIRDLCAVLDGIAS